MDRSIHFPNLSLSMIFSFSALGFIQFRKEILEVKIAMSSKWNHSTLSGSDSESGGEPQPKKSKTTVELR